MKFIIDLISWGMALGCLGTLGQMTYDLAFKAGDAGSHFVSLGKWNRQLMAPNSSGHITKLRNKKSPREVKDKNQPSHLRKKRNSMK